jgi:hypothetical protein
MASFFKLGTPNPSLLQFHKNVKLGLIISLTSNQKSVYLHAYIHFLYRIKPTDEFWRHIRASLSRNESVKEICAFYKAHSFIHIAM